MADDKREEFEHPSYGMIQFNRVNSTGSNRLFGSSLDHHYGSVRISIGPGKRIHEHNCDRYYGSLSAEMIEIEMSSAQFAEVLTSMNQGSGIPCTIRRLAGKLIENPPPVETEVEKIKSGFRGTLDQFSGKAKRYADEIIKLCERLPEKVRKQIAINLDVIQHQLTHNVPHVLEMFDEASKRVVTAAKHEIDTFAQHVGLTRPVALLDRSSSSPELTAGEIDALTERARVERARTTAGYHEADCDKAHDHSESCNCHLAGNY
jgi:hypothetical protein